MVFSTSTYSSPAKKRKKNEKRGPDFIFFVDRCEVVLSLQSTETLLRDSGDMLPVGDPVLSSILR